MRIKILLSSNPFFAASASANRWLTLIEGLHKLEVKVELVIYGNYQSKVEQEKFATQSTFNGIQIKY